MRAYTLSQLSGGSTNRNVSDGVPLAIVVPKGNLLQEAMISCQAPNIGNEFVEFIDTPCRSARHVENSIEIRERLTMASRMRRREFARQLTVGAGGLAAALTTAQALGAETPPAPKLPEEPAAKVEPPAPPLEVLLLTYLVRTYPSDNYNDVAIQGIFRDLRGDLARGKLLSEFPLKNSDEPAFVFSPYRGTDGTPVEG